jgi:CheY-like chemotaxis protein
MSESYCSIFSETLLRLGYSPIALAASGAEALRFADILPPDIVLMDLRLNGSMDGIETVQHLRALHGDFGLIYVTGRVDEEQRLRAERTLPNAWLTKPYTHQQLAKALKAARGCVTTDLDDATEGE